LASARAGSADVAGTLEANQLDSILLMGRVGGTNHQEFAPADSVTAAIHIRSYLPFDEHAPVGSSLLVFFDPRIEAEGFGGLRIRAELEGAIFANDLHVLFDEAFSDPESAEAFLAGFTLDPLGACGVVCESQFDLYFDFTPTAKGAHFSTGWLLGVQTVPEPSTAILIALGLASFSLSRKSLRGASDIRRVSR
jgi:hypothetical protein